MPVSGSCFWRAPRLSGPCPRGDQVGSDGNGPGEQELAQASFDVPLVDSDAFVLAQVVSPGIDLIDFDQAFRHCWVAKQLPLVSAATLAAPSKVVRGPDEGGLVFGRDSVLGAD